MKNTVTRNLILESVPIIGVYNKVIDTGFNIIPRVECFAFNREKLQSDKTRDSLDASEFLFYLANVRAGRSQSLLRTVDHYDFDPGISPESLLWEDDYSRVIKRVFGKGLVKEVIVIEPGKVTTSSDGRSLLLNNSDF